MKKLILSTLATLILFLSSLFSESESKQEIIEIKAIPIEETTEVIHTQTPQSTPDPYEVAMQEIEQKMSEIESIEDEMEWFIAYKAIINEYYGILDQPETIWDCFSEDEVNLICKVVETETYDQDFMSKVNVANVVLNRYYSGDFGETITEIITKPYQFAYGRNVITADTIWAVMFSFEMTDTTDGALFFHSNDKTDTFCGADYLFSDRCGHNFYGY